MLHSLCVRLDGGNSTPLEKNVVESGIRKVFTREHRSKRLDYEAANAVLVDPYECHSVGAHQSIDLRADARLC